MKCPHCGSRAHYSYDSSACAWPAPFGRHVNPRIIDHPYTPPPATTPRMGWLAFWLFVWLGSVVGYAAVGMR